ncbi:unnamed protein product [Pseudo-nitzschia multistriata]|uniref:EGF-like domain-containing protein n=1 Tax=Pseudo-nitzschia multistriata TaxID=183589 RepID=A0A448ZRF5_9STRA|nr:unnamed protein product [Pseudo-nitzschia multistriata]
MPSLIFRKDVDRRQSSHLLLNRRLIYRSSFKKKNAVLSPFWSNLCLFLLFGNRFTSAFAQVGAGTLDPKIDDCSLCSPGGKCVPDKVSIFDVPSDQYRRDKTSFHCDCFEGYSGAFCDQEAGMNDDFHYDYSEGNSTRDEANNDTDNDNGIDDLILLATEGCPFGCQNEGKCTSVFGGVMHICLCPEPFWGSQCEFNSLDEPCDLNCTSISNESFFSDGGFCVDSPQDLDDGDDHTCVHCEEIAVENEPVCENEINCVNGGACMVKYLYTDASESDETMVHRPLKCTASTNMDGNYIWEELPPYELYCECPIGYQGEKCEEIDVCGGCQNGGYCISENTPGDFNITAIFSDLFKDDDDDDDDDDNIYKVFDPDADCTCLNGGCDQRGCGSGATCIFGLCNQNGLINPGCPGGKCSQRNTVNATCFGGDCDQTNAIDWSCYGEDCFVDAAHSSDENVTPSFCHCKYGYFGEHCQHFMTTICLIDEVGTDYNAIHEFCLRSGEFCPLPIGHMFPEPFGNLFCANGGTCGDTDNFDLFMLRV